MEVPSTELVSEAAAQELPDNGEDDVWSSLKRTPYTDGWPEDKWREEIEKHPFFMTKAPDPSQELPPLVEGLQQLKYSETENTPDELAKTYKDDGNFYFKCKKYRDANLHYSAGLKLSCSAELKAQLFNNRSASNFFLKNFRSSLNDCEETLKLDPNYRKAKLRKAQCLFHLDDFDKCIETCEDLLSDKEIDFNITKLKKEAVLKKKLNERNFRKQIKQEKCDTAAENVILKAIQDRKINIRLAGNRKLMKLSDLEPCSDLPFKLKRVHLIEDRLFWPVIYSFPELTLNMPVDEFDENGTFNQILSLISEGMLEYDPDQKFMPEKVRIFFRDKDETLIEFSLHSTLRNVISSPKFVLTDGIIVFVLLLRDSEFTKEYFHHNDYLLLSE